MSCFGDMVDRSSRSTMLMVIAFQDRLFEALNISLPVVIGFICLFDCPVIVHKNLDQGIGSALEQGAVHEPMVCQGAHRSLQLFVPIKHGEYHAAWMIVGKDLDCRFVAAIYCIGNSGYPLVFYGDFEVALSLPVSDRLHMGDDKIGQEFGEIFWSTGMGNFINDRWMGQMRITWNRISGKTLAGGKQENCRYDTELDKMFLIHCVPPFVREVCWENG